MTSIRRSLVTGTVAVGAVSILAAGFFLYRIVHTESIRQFDRSMAERARTLASTIEISEGELVLDFVEFDMSEFEDDEAPSFLQVWDGDGTSIYRSPALGARDLDRVESFDSLAGAGASTTPDGRRARAVALSIVPRLDVDDERDIDTGQHDDTATEAEDGAVSGEDEDEAGDVDAGDGAGDPARGGNSAFARVDLVLVRDLGDVDDFLARLRLLFLLAGAIVLVVTALALAWVVRRSLDPLDQLAAAIAALDGPAARVRPARVPREVAPVVAELNGLLARVETLMERERGFSADVAHELRTPLAGIRSLLEVTLSRPREAAEYAGVLGQAQGIVARLQDLMQRLLYLYRLEAGQVDAEYREVDLAHVIDAVLESLAATIAERGLEVTWERADCTVTTDPMLVEIVLRNLIQNAVSHGDAGGVVRIEPDCADHTAELIVANTGSTISREEAAEVTQRFFRGDDARSADGSHWGLGLAIVARICEHVGIGLSIESESGGEFVVTLRFGAR